MSDEMTDTSPPKCIACGRTMRPVCVFGFLEWYRCKRCGLRHARRLTAAELAEPEPQSPGGSARDPGPRGRPCR
jgi:hypothetical protein